MVRAMSDLLLDIVEHLESEHLVIGDGEDSFRDFSPESPDHAVVIHEYAGSPTPLQASFTHRSLQISARDNDAAVAKAKCLLIFNELSPSNRHKVLSNGRWCQLYPRSTPFKLKVDDKGRAVYAFNIGITTERD